MESSGSINAAAELRDIRRSIAGQALCLGGSSREGALLLYRETHERPLYRETNEADDDSSGKWQLYFRRCQDLLHSLNRDVVNFQDFATIVIDE